MVMLIAVLIFIIFIIEISEDGPEALMNAAGFLALFAVIYLLGELK